MEHTKALTMQVMWILFRSRRIASQPVAIRQVLIAFRVALIGGKSKTFTIYKLLEELIGYVSMHSRAKANAFGLSRLAFGAGRRRRFLVRGGQVVQRECSDVDCVQVQQSGAHQS